MLEKGDIATISSGVAGVLSKYAEVFKEPDQLPPKRDRDHKILLEENSKAVNIRPYRYPQFQKAEMESIVKELVQKGFVRASNNPFSSPVILVKKKNGGWRLCVDYKALNTITVKDRFPISTIDELLGELKAAQVFSKLDLLSGYHQIRVFQPNIPKTAFRTHNGHFEFVVMPFGLTNAPATFQAIMNEIFGEFLGKFVIVFL